MAGKGNRMALDPQVVQDLLRTARQRGATAGDALLVDNASFEVQVRLGEVEKVQQSHQKRLGLRLFFGQRSATTSTSDLSDLGPDFPGRLASRFLGPCSLTGPLRKVPDGIAEHASMHREPGCWHHMRN